MAKRPSKLSDIFNMTNAVVRPRKDGSSSRLGRTLDIDGITSRYRRNELLVDPRSFHLMTDFDTLRKYKLFGVYKPPFAPMRRTESYENYHRVSAESYISAALKSRDMETVVAVLKRGEDPSAPYRAPSSFDTRTSTSSSSSASASAADAAAGGADGLQIRVVNDLPAEAAGPLLVHINDANTYVHNDFTRYHFEALVHGHVSLRSAEATAEAMALIRAPSANPKGSHPTVGAGGFGSLPSDSSAVGVSAVATDGMIRTGYAGTTAAMGNVVEMSNLALLYPSLAASPTDDVSTSASAAAPSIRMVDLPRERLAPVPRRSLSPSMLRAAQAHLKAHHPELVEQCEAEAAAHERNSAYYNELMKAHAEKMAVYETELAAFEKRVKDEGISLNPLSPSKLSVGIMPHAGERQMAPPSRKLAEEMLGKPERPVAPPPPPQPLIPIAAPTRTDAPIIRVGIRSFGFYATHPVTLIRFSAQSPTTAAAPDVLRFVRAVTGSYTVGDPMAKKDTNNVFVKTMRAGDRDFARAQVNLRSLGINVYQRNPMWGDAALLSSASNPHISAAQRDSDAALAASPWLPHPKYLEFACDGSLDVLVNESQMMMKRSKITLTDGYWNPTMRAGV